MKLRSLVAIHLLLAASPVVMLFQSASIWFLPVIWSAQSVLIGQLMLLAFWAGQGTSKFARRIFGTIGGTVYLAFWSSFPMLVSLWASPKLSWMDWLESLGAMLLQGGLLVLILVGVFSVIRRWFSHLDRVADANDHSQSSSYQFSIQHLLVITTVTAIFLASRRGKIDATNQWQVIIAAVLWIGTYVANAIYAIRGTLRSGPIRWRLFLVFVVAILLGIGIALLTGLGQVSWWLAAFFALAMTVPTLVMVLSLLVVRSCGYRLVPNPRVLKSDDTTDSGS